VTLARSPWAFFLPLALALGLTPIARWVGLSLELVDRPGEDLKIHRAPVPILGGLAVVASAWAGMLLLRHPPALWVVVATALALALGLADDVASLPPWSRATLQGVAGFLLVAGGLRVEPLGVLSGLGVVVAVMASANAVNLLDGQDGLAGGLSAIAALGLVAVSFHAGGQLGFDQGLALAGALVGFLAWNRPPARIFLGNGGAYAVGTLLAALAANATARGDWRLLLAAGLCMGPFIFELTLTVARRIVGAGSLVAGDRLHSYDLLAARSLGRTAVTLLFWALGAAAAALGVLVSHIPLSAGLILTAVAAAAALASGLRVWRGAIHQSTR
jgi:UDP-GlcNAc:undecaprenyl-phosphate/decaprenyl-phosphate GlcNAc-1-phosphate transferase